MNPLTNVRNIKKLNETEARLGIGEKQSWHQQYKNSAWIFVGGLPYDLTEGDVICVFSQYGEIVNINMVRDKKTGKMKGYCFICFEDQRSTVLSVDNLNGIKLLGRTLRVDHVEEYKMPKDSEDIDEVTRKIRQEGVAPRTPTSSEASEAEEETIQKVKKKKDKKKSKKSGKRERKRRSSSSSNSNSINKVVKKEKRDSSYERAQSTSDRSQESRSLRRDFETQKRATDEKTASHGRDYGNKTKNYDWDGERQREKFERSRHTEPERRRVEDDKNRYYHRSESERDFKSRGENKRDRY